MRNALAILALCIMIAIVVIVLTKSLEGVGEIQRPLIERTR